MRLVSGTQLGPYEIVAFLGAGGMGKVYRARDVRLDRTVAIKILTAREAQKSEAEERFERAGNLLSESSQHLPPL
jgi:serine/threonine protein kinase